MLNAAAAHDSFSSRSNERRGGYDVKMDSSFVNGKYRDSDEKCRHIECVCVCLCV